MSSSSIHPSQSLSSPSAQSSSCHPSKSASIKQTTSKLKSATSMPSNSSSSSSSSSSTQTHSSSSWSQSQSSHPPLWFAIAGTEDMSSIANMASIRPRRSIQLRINYLQVTASYDAPIVDH